MIADARSGRLGQRSRPMRLVATAVAATVPLLGCREPVTPRQPFHEPSGPVSAEGVVRAPNDAVSIR